MVKIYTYLEVFLEDLNKQVNLSEFESHFNKPHQTIRRHLNPFVKENILIETKKKRLREYKLNFENPLTYEHLIMCEKERMINFLNGNTLAARLFQELSPYFKSSKFLFFGSFTQNKEYDDIDILALTKDKKIKKVLQNFEQTYSKKIHLLQTDKEHLSKSLIKELREKHIILNKHEYFMEVIYE